MNNSRVALYARYSTDMQSASSIEDQLRLCREYAERMGWTIIDSYSDKAVSGASMIRPGIQALIEDAWRGAFDIVLAEALDRLSRDQEDIAGLFKRLRFNDVSIKTIAEGDVAEIHIGLKGTMNALFLKDLAQKTHRGLRGRIEAGKSGGGNAYGYKVIRSFAADGSPAAGEREINPVEAETVRRIFRDFVNGQSPRAIAHALNKENIPGPSGVGWGQSTINGNAERGTGILNNELYIGRLVWNRLRYVKDPATGKRVSRPNPPESWVITEVPERRIVDDDLWQAAKDVQAGARKQAAGNSTGETAASPKSGFWSHQRPKHLLTGLMRCGVCGGGYAKISANLFGCAAARNKGTCDNRLNIRVKTLDDIVLAGLKHRLMDPAIFKEFAAAFVAEHNNILAQQDAHFDAAKHELAAIKSKLAYLVDELADGRGFRTLKDKLVALEAREDELKAQLANQPAREPALHPNLAEVYREKVAALHTALTDPATKDEAFSIIRTLIEEVRLVPEDGALRVEIRGALAGILALSAEKNKTARAGVGSSASVLGEQIKMVAGARFERATFRL
ncbi:MAG TPA: recombinase family protein [Acidiphilium sp.]|nr:MAG: resolvase [Acidiphilium sp. 21-60-14]HQT90059.1 recombinase family protein [Acidiphilium sp.]